MNNIKRQLATKLSMYVAEATLDELLANLSEPPKPDMGDLALPCFFLSKKLRQSPVKIATEIAEKFDCGELFISAEAAGPFVNICIDGSKLAPTIIDKIMQDDHEYGSSQVGAGKTVVADYSSPNIAKPLGVHHLRSTMIGNAICNLHEKCGYEVARVNYLGDWGTQFGKLMAAHDWGLDPHLYGGDHEGPVEEMPETLTIEGLAELYVAFNKAAKEDPALEDEGREWFKALEDQQDYAVGLWQKFKEISLKEFNEIYDRLGISFTQFDGESNYSKAALDVVQECLDKGIAIEGEGGAIVIEMEGKDPPCMLRKSDGATTYLARDVGAVIKRHKDHNFVKMLYVVGHAQSFHFKQVFYVLEKMGYDFFKKCHHVPFGLLKFQGAKFSSRQGNMLLLKDVLDTAADEVAAIVKEKGNDIDKDTIDQIGIGAVVFADLSRKRISDANFKWEEILNFDGNTGPYLQYTTARCWSIMDKSAQDTSDDMRLYDEKSFSEGLTRLDTIEGKRLLLKLIQFGKVLETATENCDPAVLCQYALKLAKLTNKFIHNVRVMQEDRQLQVARATLLHCVTVVLSESLRIIGIEPLTRM
jgi:arginyl-tRNA synthetase